MITTFKLFPCIQKRTNLAFINYWHIKHAESQTLELEGMHKNPISWGQTTMYMNTNKISRDREEMINTRAIIKERLKLIHLRLSLSNINSLNIECNKDPSREEVEKK